jgi:hypothetical protein
MDFSANRARTGGAIHKMHLNAGMTQSFPKINEIAVTDVIDRFGQFINAQRALSFAPIGHSPAAMLRRLTNEPI